MIGSKKLRAAHVLILPSPMSMCVYYCRHKGLRTEIYLSKKSPYHNTGLANDSKARIVDKNLDRISPHSQFQENCLILSPCFH